MNEAINALCDVLIPGDDTWPSASAALGDTETALSHLAAQTQAWLASHAQLVRDAPPHTRVPLLQSLERAEPAMFASLLSALYDAYYNSAAAHAQVVRLAEAGPLEPSPHFDTSLLETVVKTKAGRARRA
jgi:hypothetical protein